MSVLKSELKQLVTHEVGERVEDAFEAAKRDLLLLEGRHVAMLDGSKAVDMLLEVVDKDVQDGVYDLPTATIVKRFLQRGSVALQNLAQQAANLRLVQTGKTQGFEHAVKLLQNIIEAEKAKAAALKVAEAAPPSENPRERQEGIRPTSLKELRLAEEAAPPPAAPPVTVEAAPEAAPEPLPPTSIESLVRRGGRKPRGKYSR